MTIQVRVCVCVCVCLCLCAIVKEVCGCLCVPTYLALLVVHTGHIMRRPSALPERFACADLPERFACVDLCEACAMPSRGTRALLARGLREENAHCNFHMCNV